MFAAYAYALLRIRCPAVGTLSLSQEDILELVHSGVRKQKSRIVVWYDRRTWHDSVLSFGEKLQKTLSYFR
jgi:hypothetical protein